MSFKAVALSEIPHTHPVAVFNRFWETAAAGRPVASWSAFDATEHPAILPWVLLLKREPADAGGVQWRYAVCGTGCTSLFGFSYQGKVFGEDMPPQAAADRMAEFDRAIAGGGPQFSHTRLPIPDRDFVPVFRGVFPFASAGEEVDCLFVVLADDGTRVG
jgi:hypothetical protein